MATSTAITTVKSNDLKKIEEETHFLSISNLIIPSAMSFRAYADCNTFDADSIVHHSEWGFEKMTNGSLIVNTNFIVFQLATVWANCIVGACFHTLIT